MSERNETTVVERVDMETLNKKIDDLNAKVDRVVDVLLEALDEVIEKLDNLSRDYQGFGIEP